MGTRTPLRAAKETGEEVTTEMRGLKKVWSKVRTEGAETPETRGRELVERSRKALEFLHHPIHDWRATEEIVDDLQEFQASTSVKVQKHRQQRQADQQGSRQTREDLRSRTKLCATQRREDSSHIAPCGQTVFPTRHLKSVASSAPGGGWAPLRRVMWAPDDFVKREDRICVLTGCPT